MRYNLYYLYLEDKERNQLSEEKRELILKNLKNFLKNYKTVSGVRPPSIMKTKK